jgi:hypothetical protein
MAKVQVRRTTTHQAGQSGGAIQSRVLPPGAAQDGRFAPALDGGSVFTEHTFTEQGASAQPRSKNGRKISQAFRVSLITAVTSFNAQVCRQVPVRLV